MMRWVGLGQPLAEVPAEAMPEAREELWRLRMNSHRRRLEQVRNGAAGRPMTATTTQSAARVPGPSAYANRVALEMPELGHRRE